MESESAVKFGGFVASELPGFAGIPAHPVRFAHPICGHAVEVVRNGVTVAAGVVERVISAPAELIAFAHSAETWLLSDAVAVA